MARKSIWGVTHVYMEWGIFSSGIIIYHPHWSHPQNNGWENCIHYFHFGNGVVCRYVLFPLINKTSVSIRLWGERRANERSRYFWTCRWHNPYPLAHLSTHSICSILTVLCPRLIWEILHVRFSRYYSINSDTLNFKRDFLNCYSHLIAHSLSNTFFFHGNGMYIVQNSNNNKIKN